MVLQSSYFGPPLRPLPSPCIDKLKVTCLHREKEDQERGKEGTGVAGGVGLEPNMARDNRRGPVSALDWPSLLTVIVYFYCLC